MLVKRFPQIVKGRGIIKTFQVELFLVVPYKEGLWKTKQIVGQQQFCDKSIQNRHLKRLKVKKINGTTRF